MTTHKERIWELTKEGISDPLAMPARDVAIEGIENAPLLVSGSGA